MRFFFFLVTLFVISFQAEKADAMNIQCDFYKFHHGYGFKNGCNVQSVTFSSPEDREITSVNGDHGKIYDNVWWFEVNGYALTETFHNFPKNIKKIFPNVEAVGIFYVKITTLTKSDMAPFGSQLRGFKFYFNEIEVLEEGLFDENPNLEDINLKINKIKFVASGVFDKLPKLTTLEFQVNRCHSDAAYNNRAEVLTLIRKIEEKCQDPETITTTEKIKTEQERGIEQLRQS